MTANAQNAVAAEPLTTTVARLAEVISAPHYPAGDRAALRRWAPGQPLPLAFYRLWLRHADSELPAEAHTESRMTLAWGLATTGAHAHQPGRALGQALAESRYSEGRLERLLAAPDALRADLFMSAVRFLAAKNERFDWGEAATFLFATDADKREGIRRRIASTYFRHLPKD
jgi:CRISPR system Cascade subunit CasB